ncbi:MAG: pyridoxal phosphate-dependent aminotransferase family protein [Lewinellaceae bacterium]|nr:pyridoxal phosphate-dependent aminotransferase family protein [Saprospiraceae bacterium]MCB9316031.1 pyridoxal phosphate-dependent aminotransferase family protein [Lewinellaceae bacterium]MCB9330041.1 pyridoxal phosphate-dependent aminotransferase family protein [Lewinellaceae bacterium]
MDFFDRILEQAGPLGQYAEVAEGYYMFPQLEGELGNRMSFNGKEMICWSINNYLGLANHPEVRKADADAAARWGLAYPMGARMMSGETKLHKKLEQDLAHFVGKEDGYLLNYGYQGIMSVIDSLLTRRDVVVYDAESHACIVDAVRMHLGKRFAYTHNDISSLAKNLERATKIVEETGGGILVITEGVFGMRGDQGKLREVVALKGTYNFRLLIDDAHGFGMLGKTGAGAAEEQGVIDEVDLYFSTFAKSMALIGAFIAGPKEIIRYLRYNMRSQIFAKSLPMPLVEGAIKRFELLKSKPELREQLWNNVRMLQDGLRARGLDIGDTNTCVTPVYMHGELEEAMALVKDLRENYSVFCSMVVYPVIPKGMIILRLIPTALHTEEDIRITLDAFSAVGEKLKSGAYRNFVPETLI